MRLLPFAACSFLALTACSRKDAAPSQQQAPAPISTAGLQAYVPSSTELGMERLFRMRSTFGKTSLGRLVQSADADFKTDGREIVALPTGSKNAAEKIAIHLPKLADGAVGIEVPGMRVDVRPHGFRSNAVAWNENVAVYADAIDGIDMFRAIGEEGVEDFYSLVPTRDEISFTYSVKLDRVAGLRLIDGDLELLDAAGTPRVRATRPVATDAEGRLAVGSLAVTGCAYDTRGIGPWGRPVTPPGSTECTVIARIQTRGLVGRVLVDPSWQGTKNTKQTHAYHKLLRLPSGPEAGKILVVGGTGTIPSATEIFDPTTKTWALSTSLTSGVTLGQGMNAVVLPSGVVLACGGFPTSGSTTIAQQTCVQRAPATGAWTPAAAMTQGRAWHAMAAVKIGGVDTVLVAGGQPQSSIFSTSLPNKTAEYWDPTTDDWTLTGALAATNGRTQGRAVVLGDGKVLYAGGEGYSSTTLYLSTSEIFNPATKTWTAGPNTTVARVHPELVALSGTTEKAIIAGGATTGFASSAVDSLEYFDGTTWTLLTAKMSVPRWMFASTRLDDGRVLFAGGQTYNSTSFLTTVTELADLFLPGSDPKTGTVVGAGGMAIARQNLDLVNVPTLGGLAVGGLTSTSVGTETTASELFNTVIGGACGTGCPTGLNCIDGVCCDSGGSATCPTGSKCNSPGREGVCTKANGATCAANSECASGYCVGGFCCESACSGGCKSCDATGKCINAAAGTDPGGFCTSTSDPICGRKCNGTGACSSSYAPEGTACGASAPDAGGSGSFCNIFGCTSWGSCSSKTNNCGLTCTTTVTCNEATKTCTATAGGIKPGFCVIEGTCYAYGDINPADSCKVCDPPTTKTDWSVAAACMDGSVDDTGDDDTGATDDTGTDDTSTEDTSVPDTSPIDTGMVSDDTGTLPGDDASTATDLPEAKACGCRTPGESTSSGAGVFAMIALGLVVAARRR